VDKNKYFCPCKIDARNSRVSTRDQQTLPMQLKIMKDYVKNRGWDTVIQIEETSSGIKERKKLLLYGN